MQHGPNPNCILYERVAKTRHTHTTRSLLFYEYITGHKFKKNLSFSNYELITVIFPRVNERLQNELLYKKQL